MTAIGTENLQVTPCLETSELHLRKLVVAIDFSPETPHALEAALVIARSFESELVLVHGSIPQVYGRGAELAPVETFEIAVDMAKEMMTDLVTNTRELGSVKHREIVTYSDPVDLIEQVVKDEKADLVVAGSHSASCMERLALGSVAQSILQRVACPTLVVGPHAISVEHPFRSILLATDLESTGLRAAQYASGLAERFHGKLTLLHVVPKAIQNGHGPALDREILSALRRLVPTNLAIYTSGEVRVEYGKAGEMISHVEQSTCPSLIVMGVRERALFSDHGPWSTLAHVIREAHCPVLVVRRTLQ